mgnify:CR=1 FL=1
MVYFFSFSWFVRTCVSSPPSPVRSLFAPLLWERSHLDKAPRYPPSLKNCSIHCHRLNPLLQKVADAFKHDRKIWFPRYNIGFNDAPATLPVLWESVSPPFSPVRNPFLPSHKCVLFPQDVEAPALVLFPHGFPPVSFPLKKYPFDDSIVAPIIAFIQEHRSVLKRE